MRVVALVLGGPGQAAVLRAVDAQERSPAAVVALTDEVPAGGFADALARELAGGEADWYWLLDGLAVPEPDALAAFLGVLEDLGPLPAPLVLASKVQGTDGRTHPGALPWPDVFEKQVTLDASEKRFVHLRAARHGSLLVSRAAVERFGLPRAEYESEGDDLEWTARMLAARADHGYLVTTSVAARDGERVGADERLHRDVRNRVDMLRRDAWHGPEKLWFGFVLAQDLAREARAGRGVGRLARAVRAGLR